MKKIFCGVALILLIGATGIKCFAQDNGKSLIKQVVKENQEAVNAIAMYPTETRKIIFEAAEYPEVIAKLNGMQKNSQNAFENIISSLSKEEQEKIWDMTRYDGLISDITANQNKSDAEFNTILGNYPEEIHKTALEEQKNNYDLLVRIDKINKSYNSDFELLLKDYPPKAIAAFREIIKMPEVLDILFDHMQYTVVVGDYYKKNPEKVLHKTDSINLVLIKKNTVEADDWKQSMNDNPKAQEEYTQAAQEYARDNGYQPDDYKAPLTQDVTNYNTYPYCWWFGYPSWYPYDYWVPYPYWYDWGFYFGPGGRIVFFGLPSEYFMEWFFYYPEHFSRYAELSDHYYNYYDRHRGSRNNNSISRSVNDWRDRNKDIITADWDKDKSKRIQRFKEYGNMEKDRREYNAKNPKQPIAQTEYLQKEQKKYPIISADVSKRQLIQKDSKTPPIQESRIEPVKKPPVPIPDHYRVPGNGEVIIEQSKPVLQESINVNPISVKTETTKRTDNVNPQPRNPNPVKQPENFNQIREAQQYHQNTWQQIQQQPVRQPQQQNIAPPPRQQENRQAPQPIKQNTPAPSNNKRK